MNNVAIGDLVEIISPTGMPTGICKLVLGVRSGTTYAGPVHPGTETLVFLYLEGESGSRNAAYCKIVSKARRK